MDGRQLFGGAVLALVFLDEVLALVALGVWGAGRSPGWLWAAAVPLVAAALWGAFASPKAPWGGAVARPATKLVVLGGAAVALAAAGHPVLAAAFAAFSLAVNGAAQLPSVRGMAVAGGA